ncbi:MAG: glycosyltransferase family 1 protein [Pedosphaera sp.]|nr:glycosyltransferase family 1 protein [Pedosphaera sp.]
MPASPKVIHCVPALFGEQGGIVGGGERYAYELARYMADLTPTTILSYGPQDFEEQRGPLRVRILGNPHYVRGQRSNPLIFRRYLRQLSHADVIHCHQKSVALSSLAAAYGRFTGRPVFTSDLGGGGWDISSYISTDKWYRGHLHISSYSRTISGHGSAPWATVIYGGVDSSLFCPSVNPGNRRSVVFTGRLMPHKGVNDLVEAIPATLPLAIIGQPYHEEFVELLKQLSLGKNVSFLHGLNDRQLVSAYQSALCVVLPSVYKSVFGGETLVPELLGQTLLEGMACGAPVLCTDVASMPEIVRHGIDGFVVPPNNPGALRERIVWLSEHPEEAAKMGANGRQRILDHFVWPTVARRCLEFYSSVGKRSDIYVSELGHGKP